MTIKIGDPVLWRYSMPPLGMTYFVTDRNEVPKGWRLTLKLASMADLPIPYPTECDEQECCAVPDGWEDAPDCPACRFGKWDGAVVDEEAMRVWYNQSMAWHRKHRLPLMVRMGWFELQEWPK